MKKVILFLAMILLSINSFAEGYKILKSNGSGNYWVDFNGDNTIQDDEKITIAGLNVIDNSKTRNLELRYLTHKEVEIDWTNQDKRTAYILTEDDDFGAILLWNDLASPAESSEKHDNSEKYKRLYELSGEDKWKYYSDTEFVRSSSIKINKEDRKEEKDTKESGWNLPRIDVDEITFNPKGKFRPRFIFGNDFKGASTFEYSIKIAQNSNKLVEIEQPSLKSGFNFGAEFLYETESKNYFGLGAEISNPKKFDTEHISGTYVSLPIYFTTILTAENEAFFNPFFSFSIGKNFVIERKNDYNELDMKNGVFLKGSTGFIIQNKFAFEFYAKGISTKMKKDHPDNDTNNYYKSLGDDKFSVWWTGLNFSYLLR